MFVSRQNLAHYLVERRLLSLPDVLEGRVRVYDVGSRHRNFMVEHEGGSALFVKQSRAVEPSTPLTLRREALFYYLTGSDPAYETIRPLVPVCRLYDTARNIVVMEGLGGAESLLERRLRLRRYPPVIGERIAAMLSGLHRTGAAALQANPRPDLFPRIVPRILSYAEMSQEQARAMPGGERLHALVTAQPAVVAGMRALRAEWSPATLIHGDFKGPNCMLARADDDEKAATGLRFVDWEMVDQGDPCWDAGAVVYDALHLPLALSVEPAAANGGPVPPFGGPAPLLHEVKPVLGAFWARYCADLELSGPGKAYVAEKVIRCAAARCIQSALEHAVVVPYTHACVRLASYLWSAPGQAARDVLGIG